MDPYLATALTIYAISAIGVIILSLWLRGENDDDVDYLTGVVLIAMTPVVNTIVVIASVVEIIREKIKK